MGVLVLVAAVAAVLLADAGNGRVSAGSQTGGASHGSAADARGGAGASGGAGATEATQARRAAARAAHATPAVLAAERREDRAIDAVLAYTPFITAGGTARREVALTFDDGPSMYTERILRILRERHVPATFFVVGQQLNDFARPFGQELRDGERVEDHTENHAWMSHLRGAGQLAQIRDAALRERFLGAPFPRLFRPPYGVFDKVTRQVTHFAHMLIVLWSVDTRDWARPGTTAIIQRALSGARPGAIILMHDGGGYRDQTVTALPAIIRGLERRHFRLVTVPRLLLDDPPAHHQHLPTYTGA